MRTVLRNIWDKSFTSLATVSVALMVASLVVILLPMFLKGATAVFFRGTVEYRVMQHELFERGDAEAIQAERAQAETVRAPVYEILDRFSAGIDVDNQISEARKIYRRYKDELRHEQLGDETEWDRRDRAQALRDQLIDALRSDDRAAAETALAEVLTAAEDPVWEGSAMEELFALATRYQVVVGQVDLARREEYGSALDAVQTALFQLFGPRPGTPTPALPMERYGATRWDKAQEYLRNLQYEEVMAPGGADGRLVREWRPRTEQFAGTEMVQLFEYVDENLEAMLLPQRTIYWQYFVDDSVSQHFFGGVGPEILGTVIITALAMLFAVPLGITSAAYLVECAGDNVVVRLIRMCVNTLAGVPSIVFGLFGLAFFVGWVMPALGQEPRDCILTASLTLAVLVLPIIIRASEEAIRAVPGTYRQASLALGAGRFRTFVLVTLPAALPGILTGIILSLSRAAGETAPILFTGAVASGSIPRGIFDRTRVLSYGSYDIAVGDRVAMMAPHKQYGMVITLILLVLCLNILAIWVRSRTAKKLRGS